jgi:ATP-dependent Clp protease protease subunit
MSYRIPYVIEKGEKDQEKVYDLYSRLLKDRIIFLSGGFTPDMADSIVAQLLFLEASDGNKDICMYINSPGGEISAMYAIYDTMCYIKPDIITVGYGMIASAGSFVLSAGTKGKRCALPNTNIMMHELAGGTSGKYGDMRVAYKHLSKVHERMVKHYSEMTGQDLEKVKTDMERDYYMTPEEAKEYGLIDSVEYKRE